jgi:phenylacetate-CoA ligase
MAMHSRALLESSHAALPITEESIRIFSAAKHTVKAYRQVLVESGLETFSPSSLDDWRMLPVLDKKTYINRFSPENLSPNDRIPPAAHASSGSSGQATFWFRGPKHNQIGTAYFNHIVDDVLQIPRSQRTLVVVCFAMGVWVAGTYTLMAFDRIGQEEDRKVTVVAPGMEIDDVASILTRLAPSFDHTVVVGYPAALDLLFNELAQRGVATPVNLHLITSGDKIAEDWRSSRMSALGIRAASSVINVYGSADGGLLAIETPLTIRIRRRLSASPALSHHILGKGMGAAAIFQFDPRFFYFEQVDGELLFTADLDIPLVRYNLHDSGKVISYSEMMSLVADLGIRGSYRFDWPFLVLSGRTDVAVILYGAKVFPDALARAAQDDRIRHLLSGSILAYSVQKGFEQIFCLDLEMAGASNCADPRLPETIAQVIQERLTVLSSEYRNSCRKLGLAVTQPHVALYPKGDVRLLSCATLCEREKSLRGKAVSACIQQAGKKPKVLPLSN